MLTKFWPIIALVLNCLEPCQMRNKTCKKTHAWRWHPLTQTLTRGSHNTLPLLKQSSFEAVSRTEAVDLMSTHQLLHWLQYDTQLQTTPSLIQHQYSHTLHINAILIVLNRYIATTQQRLPNQILCHHTSDYARFKKNVWQSLGWNFWKPNTLHPGKNQCYSSVYMTNYIWLLHLSHISLRSAQTSFNTTMTMDLGKQQ